MTDKTEDNPFHPPNWFLLLGKLTHQTTRTENQVKTRSERPANKITKKQKIKNINKIWEKIA